MLQKKSTFFVFLSVFLCIFTYSMAYSCEYGGQIEECVSANKIGTTKSIEDFVCIVGNEEEVTYQVIVDQEFKILDEEMDKYYQDLENSKNYYFGKDRVKTFIDGLNEVESKRKYFKQKLNKLCGTNIVNKAIACLDEKTSITNAKDYFRVTDCNRLVDTKLKIFDEVSYSLLLLNKEQVRSDEKKLYDQGERKNYDLLLELMAVNLGYIATISEKWNTKLQNCH